MARAKTPSKSPTRRKAQAKSWQDKLAGSAEHVVKPAPKDFAGIRQGQRMLIPSAQLVDEAIRRIPHGEALDVRALRKLLAKRLGAEETCPMTFGIQLRVVAEAAFEAYNAGQRMVDVTPVWRVIDSRTPTLKKLSYDVEFITGQRAAEGLAP